MLLAVAPWPGTLIHDDGGDVFTVDLDGGMALEYIATTDEVMSDMAFSPQGELYGVTLPWWGGNSYLYSFLSDFESATPSIETESVLAIATEASEPLYLNGLTFSPAGEMFAIGSKFPVPHSNTGFLFRIDPETGTAEEVLELTDAGVDYSSSGDLAFDSDGNLYVTTVSGHLLRIPPEQGSFEMVGNTGQADLFGLTYGPAPLLYAFDYNEGVYRLDPATGEATKVAQLDHEWLDFVNGAATIFPAPTDLGEVDFRELSGQATTLGEIWYRVEPTHGAILTVEVTNVDPASEIDLTLYEFGGDGDLDALVTGRLRIDYEGTLDFDPGSDEREYFVKIEGAGPTVDLRIANLFRPSGNGAIVYGTDDGDTFDFVPGPPYTITVNGVAYEYDFSASSLVEVSFDGGAGHDLATLAGSGLDDVATLSLDTLGGTVTRSSEWEVQVSNTEEIDFDGGDGEDSATLIGSALADTITLEPGAATVLGQGGARVSSANTPTIEIDGGPGTDSATFTGTSARETIELRPLQAHFEEAGSGFSADVSNVETVSAHGGGGDDQAVLRDSAGADTFTAGPNSAVMSRQGFTLVANDFPTVLAFASDDGHADKAILEGLPGSEDRFRSWSTEAKMTGAGFFIRAKGFGDVVARASDSADVAELYDSTGADALEAYADRATMSYAGGAVVRADDFRWVHAFASDDGQTDTARFYDTTADLGTSYAAWFQGELDASKMYSGSVFYNRAIGFDDVIASATGGNDRGRLHDSPGDDTVDAYADGATMFHAGGKTVGADGFRWLFTFASDDGQIDTARLYDTTADLGTSYAVWFKSFPGLAKMYEASFYNRVDEFDVVIAFAQGSNDSAKLYDSPGADALSAYADRATMSYADGTTARADDFRWVLAYASDDGQFDTAELYDTTADSATSYASWFKADDRIARLYHDPVFYVQAQDFDGVSATAVGDDDTAKLFDSALDDEYWSRPDHGRMDYGDGTYAEAFDFRYLLGYSYYGSDKATLDDEATGGTSYAVRFAGYATWAKLFHPEFYSRTEGFAEVRAALSDGDDLAWLYDDPSRVDHLVVPFLGDVGHAPAKATLWNDQRAIYVDEYHTLTATTSQSFQDDEDVDAAYEDDVILVGDWAAA